MRWVFLLLVILSLPLLIAYAKKGTKQRDKLLMVLGALFFASGTLALDASLITWPVWPGTARGIVLSFVDSIALALLVLRPKKARTPPFLVICGLFLLTMIIASFGASVKMASLFAVLQFAQLALLYFALSGELARPSAISSLLKGIAVGLIVQAGFVAYQKLTGVVQAPGSFFHQNVLGMATQLAAAPLLAAILEGERNKLAYGGVIAACICVAGGGSRASMAFFALALALTILVSLIRRSTALKWKTVGMAVIMAAFFVPMALGTLQARFGTLEISTEDESRVAFERAARAIAEDHPLGVGPNNFVTINNTQGYAADAGIAWGGGLLDKPVHNAYLLARSETGWFGQIMLFLLLTGVALAGFWAAFRDRRTPTVGIAVGSAVGVTTIALHSNYEFAWYVMELQRLFFVNAAIVAGCLAIAAEKKLQNRNARRLKAAPSVFGPAAGERPLDGQGVSYGN